MAAADFRLPRFYPIVDVAGADDRDEIRRCHDLAVALASAGASLIQVRAKSVSSRALARLCEDLVGPLSKRECVLIVNDRVDVALAAGTAGVHVGDEDLPVAVARRLLGPEAVIGFSTHTIREIREAPDEADYLAFGPVFESPTKTTARRARGLALLEHACRQTRRPVVAIGGVTLARARTVWRAGAASAAVISEITRADDVPSLVRSWLQAAHDYDRPSAPK